MNNKIFFYVIDHTMKKQFVCETFSEVTFVSEAIRTTTENRAEVRISMEEITLEPYRIINVTDMFCKGGDTIPLLKSIRIISSTFIGTQKYRTLMELFKKELSKKKNNISALFFLSVWIDTIYEYNELQFKNKYYSKGL